METKYTGTVVVLTHLAVLLGHGSAHSHLQIDPNSWQRAFITLVIFVGPLIAVALLWTLFRRVGIVLLALSMGGSLVFGVTHHFLLDGADNALGMNHGHWQSVFCSTAVSLALVEAGGFGWCIWSLRLARPRNA
jgi:nitrate reductase NapE component